MPYDRLDYLRQQAKELLQKGFSEAYIEAVLYTGAYSMTEINQAIKNVKEMFQT